jgi:two-component system LytT family sensor kinase
MKPLILRIALFLICLIITFQTGYSQKHPTMEEFMKNKVLLGKTYMDTTNATPQQRAYYLKQVRLNKLANEHYYFNWLGKENFGVRFQPGSTIYEGLKQRDNGHDYTSVLVDGTTSVEIISQNIDSEEKMTHYLYRVIKNNNQELVGWQLASDIRTSADGSVRYAYLGKFNYSPGQFLKVEIYNIQNFNDQDAILIDWRKVEPAKVDGYIQYLSKRFPLPDNGFSSKGITDIKQTTEKYFKYSEDGSVGERPVSVKDFIETTSKDDIKFRADDSVQNILFNLGKRDAIYKYKISLKRTVNGKTDSINLGEDNSRFILYKEFWGKPGKYKITFTPKIYKPGGNPIKLLRDKATSISFTVLPPLTNERTLPLKTVGYIIVILLTTGGFMFFANRDRQKRKLAREAQNRQIATLQLQSVRAQLNPHFIFNALAGIQNLMNKNEVENANRYLSKFAKLTRSVLDDAGKELTTIEQEADLLNDYLLMEQMRFGFNFEIAIDEKEIDQQIEIPAMLLQPFVENAVKHGVTALKDQGFIKVIITKTGSTLVLVVKDNGGGFSSTPGKGVGMRLCEERIKLLNSIYKNTNIVMHKTSDSNGTLITIELRDWL